MDRFWCGSHCDNLFLVNEAKISAVASRELLSARVVGRWSFRGIRRSQRCNACRHIEQAVARRDDK